MTDRLPLGQHTDDTLTALYERLAKAEQEADTSVAAAAHLTTLVGKRSKRAERAAEKQGRRADIAERELRTLRSGLRANGADPTQLQNLWAQIQLRNRQWREAKQRAERAEAERDQHAAQLAAARELHVRNPHSGTCEHCSENDYPDYAVTFPCPTIRALDTAAEGSAPC